jgi:hypothetical protein
MNPMEGPRIMTGAELKQIRDEADFSSGLRDTTLIAAVTTLEKTELDGTPCYRVQVDWKSGRQTFDCYAIDTGLLHGSTFTSQTAMGALEAVAVYSEYRDFDGIRLATVSTQKVFGQQLVTRIESVSFDAIDDAAFGLPAEIKALVAPGKSTGKAQKLR